MSADNAEQRGEDVPPRCAARMSDEVCVRSRGHDGFHDSGLLTWHDQKPCERCGATPTTVQTFCAECGPTSLCGDCTTAHLIEVEDDGSVTDIGGHNEVGS